MEEGEDTEEEEEEKWSRSTWPGKTDYPLPSTMATGMGLCFPHENWRIPLTEDL